MNKTETCSYNSKELERELTSSDNLGSNEIRKGSDTFTEVITQLMNSPPKGIFLLDDSPPAIGIRLEELKIPNKQVNREQYYEIFISALHHRYLSGISVSQELLDLYDFKGESSSHRLVKEPILIGLRLDMGIVPLNYNELEKKECLTEGIEYLSDRLGQCTNLGISFTRWRSVYSVSQNRTPTCFCLNQNSKALAQFVAVSQLYGMVPIAEVELLKVGNYSLELGTKVLEKVLGALAKALVDEDVDVHGAVVQVGMVSGGEGTEGECSPEEIAEATLGPLTRTLPAGLGGVAISSGGLSEDLASRVLNAIALKVKEDFPWPLTFAFGRGLQESAFRTWMGDPGNIQAAQEEFRKRQEANTRARCGFYSPNQDNILLSSMDVLYKDKYIY